MHPKIELFVAERKRALARGDMGVYRSISADLARYGYSEEDGSVAFEPVGATFAVESLTARADEQGGVATASPETKTNKGGRPKLPRCEHGNVADRCVECQED